MPNSATATPARQKTAAIRIRRLKKADRDVDFFFIDELELAPSAAKPGYHIVTAHRPPVSGFLLRRPRLARTESSYFAAAGTLPSRRKFDARQASAHLSVLQQRRTLTQLRFAHWPLPPGAT
jgi:hypothetical protein